MQLCIYCMIRDSSSRGFPHSDICGSRLICSSPQLFAACRVLLRLLMPRHSPCALLRLNFLIRSWRLSSSWLFSLVLLLELSQIIVVWSCLHYFYFFAFCAIFVVLFYQRFLERPSWFSGLFLYNLIIVQSFLNYLFVFFSLLDYSVFHDHLGFASIEELQSFFMIANWFASQINLVGLNGLGPSTSRLSGGCSNQLSYKPICCGLFHFVFTWWH